MARIDVLTNFLTDVSNAIRQKTGGSNPIPASTFDTEILSIETVGNYQEKNIIITENGTFNLLPDTGYDAISNVRMTIDVEGSTPMEPTTATQDDVISPKTFYSNGQKLVGSIIPEYRREDGTPDTNSNIPNNGTTVCVTPDKKYVIQFGGSFYIYDVKSSQLIKTITISNFSGTRRYIAIANEPYDTNKYFMYISNTVGGLYMYSYDSEEMTISYLHYTNFGNNYNDTIFAMSKEQPDIMAVATRSYIRTYKINTSGIAQISNSGIGNERTGSLEFQKHDTILVHNDNMVHDSNHRTYVIKLNANFAIVFNNNIANDGSTISFFNNSNYCIRVVGNNTTPKLYSYVDNGNSFSYTLVATWSLQTYASKNYYIDESDTFLISQAYNNSRIAIFKMDMSTFNDPILLKDYAGPSTYYDLGTIVPVWFGKNYSYFTWIGGGVNYYTNFLYDVLVLDRFKRGNSYYNSEYDGTANTSDILTGKRAYSKGIRLDGTMPDNGNLIYNPSVSSQSIPLGYTSGGTIRPVTSDIDINIIPGNIRNGVTILGVNGTYTGSSGGDATSDASLQAKYLLEGYSAVVDGQLIQGTMPNRGAVTITATSNDVIIPEGFYTSLSIPIINAANCEDYTECNTAILSI